MVPNIESMLKKEFDFEDANFEEEGMPRVVKFFVDRGLILKPVEEPLGECRVTAGGTSSQVFNWVIRKTAPLIFFHNVINMFSLNLGNAFTTHKATSRHLCRRAPWRDGSMASSR